MKPGAPPLQFARLPANVHEKIFSFHYNPKREYKDIEALFDLCERVSTDIDTGRIAGLYAKQFSKAFEGISLEDYLLAATARTHSCPLWTATREHYPMTDVELFA